MEASQLFSWLDSSRAKFSPLDAAEYKVIAFQFQGCCLVTGWDVDILWKGSAGVHEIQYSVFQERINYYKKVLSTILI